MLDKFKKEGEKKLVAVKFTLTSNNSEGLVTYASSPGIDPLLGTVLWYSSEMEGSNRQGIFSSLDMTNPNPYSKRTPIISYLFSNKRKGRIVVSPSPWGPSDKRQPFDVDASSRLYLSVSHLASGDILVNGITPHSPYHKKKGHKMKKVAFNFKFFADCMGEDILYGFTGSSAYIISFNGFMDFPGI